MNARTFRICLILLAAAFTVVFVAICIPPFLKNPDIMGAFAAGFVNPYASGYSTDVLVCWAILAVWVVYEAKVHSVKKYLLLRMKQIKT